MTKIAVRANLRLGGTAFKRVPGTPAVAVTLAVPVHHPVISCEIGERACAEFISCPANSRKL